MLSMNPVATAQQMIEEELSKDGGEVYVVKKPDGSNEEYRVHSVELIDGHRAKIVATDKDGIAVRGDAHYNINKQCSCDDHEEVLSEQPDLIIGDALEGLIMSTIDKIRDMTSEHNREAAMKYLDSLKGDIERASKIQFKPDTMYVVDTGGDIQKLFFYCTRVGVCEDTGLVELGGFEIGHKGISRDTILGVSIKCEF